MDLIMHPNPPCLMALCEKKGQTQVIVVVVKLHSQLFFYLEKTLHSTQLKAFCTMKQYLSIINNLENISLAVMCPIAD